MIMNFHCAGTVSCEEMNKWYENNEVIVLGDGDDCLSDKDFKELNKSKHEDLSGADYWIFDKATGKCLNDNCSFGCYRTLKI